MNNLLVANRGEIARRIIRTAHEMGLRTVGVFTDADARAPHVREADVSVRVASYLDAASLVDAARTAGADAVHPGYGFLSERAPFAEACLHAGLVWVGPQPATIRAMGDKIEAKRLMAAAGVPVLPEGTEAGFPLVVKAAAGGGGRGMRVVSDPAELDAAMESASREASSSFGDGTVFLERWLAAPRHIEVQVFGDVFGTVVHLGERDCSVQRRHQKIIEESPAVLLSDATRARMFDAAVAGAKAIGYIGAGTFEFVVEDDEFFFLEMNTRLQVEHPVTEGVTGLDLVRLQLEIAEGLPLSIGFDGSPDGHAIEARLYAEDPSHGYLPSPGTVSRWRPGPTPSVRYDAGVEDGTPVPPDYDAMLAKVIVHARTREEATARLIRALRELHVHGVKTNRDQLVRVLESEAWAGGGVTTNFLDTFDVHPLVDEDTAVHHAIAAALAGAAARRLAAPVAAFAPPGWRNVGTAWQHVEFDGLSVSYDLSSSGAVRTMAGGRGIDAVVRLLRPDRVELDIDGVVSGFDVHGGFVNTSEGQTEWREVPRFVVHAAEAAGRGPTAPLPGTIVSVDVQSGDQVSEGQVLVVLEAMKMEHRILSPLEATVVSVFVGVGDRVDAGHVLVALE